MTVKISQNADVQRFFKEAAGLNNDQGSPRIKQLLLRIISDTAKIVEDLDVTEDEFWKAVEKEDTRR